jgi:N-acetylglucosamine malate deacetylase 2
VSTATNSRIPDRIDRLPRWRSVLTVVAHPDDESFGLGAVVDVLAASGAAISVLCFTHGEATTVHAVPGRLHQVRARELTAAADILGVLSARDAELPRRRAAQREP